jgi:hypothetical protein
LSKNLTPEVQLPEDGLFLWFPIGNGNVHKKVYCLLINAIVVEDQLIKEQLSTAVITKSLHQLQYQKDEDSLAG